MIRVRMLLNILRRPITCRITRNTNLVRILVNPNIVHPHRSRPRLLETRPVQHRERWRHTKIQNWVHGLHGDHSLADVAVGANSLGVDGPGLLTADEPGYVPLGSGRVFKGVDLVFFAVVPVVVEIGEAGGDLLEGATTIGVDCCDGWVVDGSEVCLALERKYINPKEKEMGAYHNQASTICHTAPTADSERPHQSDPASRRAQSH